MNKILPNSVSSNPSAMKMDKESKEHLVMVVMIR